MKTAKRSLTGAILREKCPHCGEGDVFKKNKKIVELPSMNDKCDKCGYVFDREPGYFLGAMYISYGLAVLQGIIAFVICYLLFPGLSTVWTTLIVTGIIALFSMKNYKLSRIIYIHIFPF